jgi:hypothetical protein
MKKIIFLALITITGIIVLESFGTIGLGKKDGTEPGYTGSPGDSLKNCTACHGGMAMDVEGWITSNIPEEGYMPGATYTVTATNTEFGATRFGFEVSPQALNGDLMGTMVITDTTTTKLVGNDKYITYKAAGVDGVDSRSWTFDWIAPAAGSGNVVFYGAFNSNYNGDKGGDHTYLTTLKVKEFGTTGVADLSNNITSFSVYPNPSTDFINVTVDAKTTESITIDLLDLTGKSVIPSLTYTHGMGTKRISTEEVANGIYLIRLQAGGQTSVQKINIIH